MFPVPFLFFPISRTLCNAGFYSLLFLFLAFPVIFKQTPFHPKCLHEKLPAALNSNILNAHHFLFLFFFLSFDLFFWSVFYLSRATLPKALHEKTLAALNRKHFSNISQPTHQHFNVFAQKESYAGVFYGKFRIFRILRNFLNCVNFVNFVNFANCVNFVNFVNWVNCATT